MSLLLEGALTGAYVAWSYHRYLAVGDPSLSFAETMFGSIDWRTVPPHIMIGLVAALPLFGVNYLLFGPLSHRKPSLSSCFEFKDRIVKPLANELDLKSAAVVALCAGIGEELFFRGLLQNEFGLVAASVAFSLLHFGPAVRKYVFIAMLYVVIGAYFGWLYLHTGTLWSPIVTHVVYDFCALLYMRYAYISPIKTPSRALW